MIGQTFAKNSLMADLYMYLSEFALGWKQYNWMDEETIIFALYVFMYMTFLGDLYFILVYVWSQYNKQHITHATA